MYGSQKTYKNLSATTVKQVNFAGNLILQFHEKFKFAKLDCRKIVNLHWQEQKERNRKNGNTIPGNKTVLSIPGNIYI